MSCQIGYLVVLLKCTRNWAQAYWGRPVSSAFNPFVPACPSDADRSFVVRNFCAPPLDIPFLSKSR